MTTSFACHILDKLHYLYTMNKDKDILRKSTEFLLYKSPEGGVSMEVFVYGETVWLTQKMMAELFGIEVQTINYHLKEVFKSAELSENSTIRKFRIVQNEAGREVARDVAFYNLDAIISVGYRVNSKQATHFRRWATGVLHDYIIKGFAMDDELLKNGTRLGKDYFKELLDRVRSIRASERRIYEQITDIFAECSIDYDPQSDVTKTFYAMVQNKFHFAIAGKTAAEIINEKADRTKPNMGLMTWKHSPDGRLLKSDVKIAKNYLSEEEIRRLERTVSGFFDYIENVIENRKVLKMEDLVESVDKFLNFNEYKILNSKGSVSMEQAERKAFAEYDEFNKTQKIESDFDREVNRLIGGKSCE